VERPDKFLEVVYCDIGFGDCKSIGNGALYCITLVDRATRQNQNSLVEQAWETATNMAQAFITDMQMPKNFWYWALCQSIQVMNYIPCTVSGMSTTPHELVYGTKPDLHVLFRLFSTGYFRKLKDSSYHRSGISTSTSM